MFSLNIQALTCSFPGIKMSSLTSDRGMQSLDSGIVKMSEAWEVFLQSILSGGNLTVAIPSCSLMEATTPILLAIPLPSTYEEKRNAFQTLLGLPINYPLRL